MAEKTNQANQTNNDSDNGERVVIREMDITSSRDRAGVWEILCPIIRGGDVYALPTNWDEETTLNFWCHQNHRVYVAYVATTESDDYKILGTYYIQPNQQGNGSHVCNCGYATHSTNMSRGIGYEMCLHSLTLARELGYYAMQYNFVISTNIRAVKLWQRCGFNIVGTLPEAFKHPRDGYVDVFVMYQKL